MCGIAGFLSVETEDRAEMVTIAASMTAALAHRGPDDRGLWTDVEAGIAFGQQRLAIVDLSLAGRQPMVSTCGRFVISYNGEIYNAPELRGELAAAGHNCVWRGHSDTEVLLEACARWGIEGAVRRTNGMFAFALWDRRRRVLHLARDRMGIKPLYWAQIPGRILFGSELKALRRHPAFAAEIDVNALAAFMRHGYLPAPHTIYCRARKLEPGAILSTKAGQKPTILRYWDMADIASATLSSSFDTCDEGAMAELEVLLMDSIKRQMVADVPLGVFLSGGVDSSTIAALMQAQASRPVRSFTVGFENKAYDEAPYAKALAEHLGTDHTELYVSAAQAREVVPSLPRIFDEPFADASQIPTFLLSKLTREHVTVALAGDGGDELFAGYRRYLQVERIERLMRMPRFLRRTTVLALHAFSPKGWDRALGLLSPKFSARRFGDRLHKLADLLEVPETSLYHRITGLWPEPSAIVPGGVEVDEPAMPDARLSALERLQYNDVVTYLPEDILAKTDRASMAVGLEVRVPLLDHRVVEFASRLERRLKLRKGKSKWLLRQVLYRHVPEHLIERPKMGFSIPIDSWLRGPLRDWAEALLSAKRLSDEGFLDPTPVQRAWSAHILGTANHADRLWCVLMFQAWLEAQRASPERAPLRAVRVAA
jgi:asparagine synthase (glutamine-hydrolysing)